jgi:hypothetical protein
MDYQGKKAAFYTLGCKLNFSETSTIAGSFKEVGFERVEFEEKADVYVINTCSVHAPVPADARPAPEMPRERSGRCTIMPGPARSEMCKGRSDQTLTVRIIESTAPTMALTKSER